MTFTKQPIEGYPGTWMAYAVDQEQPAPVGFVMFRRPLLNTLEILYIFVHDDFRRQGVATGLLDWLKAEYQGAVIATAQTNSLSESLFKKHGFRATTNGWFLFERIN